MVMNLLARLAEVARLGLAFAALNLVLTNVMLPALAFTMFTDAFVGLPVPAVVVVGAGAWALSGPGLAAAFAAYRDSHLLRPAESHDARTARTALARDVDALAGSYWRDAEDTRVVRPFLRAWLRVLRRSLAVSGVFGAAVAGLLVTALVTLRHTPAAGDPVAAVLLAVTAFALVGWLVALTLVVELPRARTGAVIRTALLVTARRPLLAVLSLGVIAVYGYTLLAWPLVVLTVGAGLLFFFAAHISQAIAKPVRDTLVAEHRAAAARTGTVRTLRHDPGTAAA